MFGGGSPIRSTKQSRFGGGLLALLSGHDFRRAVENEKRIELQPLPGRTLPEILCPERILGRKKVQGPTSVCENQDFTNLVP
jgi:hypothetical protein